MTVLTGGFWRDRRVLVTGHTGLKGAWLCLLLRRLGAEVAGYALAPPTQPSLYALAEVDDLVHSTLGDVRDLDLLEETVRGFRPEVLIHMAAQSVVLSSYHDPIETYTTNVIGTVHALEAVRRAGRPAALVNVTTDKVYRNEGWVWGYRESDALCGRDPYSSSKACAELVAQAYRTSFFQTERLEYHRVAIACARAGNVIAGGDWTPHQLIPHVVAAFARGEPVTLRNPEGIRPWQHVLDCLHGYLALAEGLATVPASHIGAWNFGPADDDVHTVAQVVEALASHWRQTPAWSRSAGAQPPEEHELRLDCSKTRRQLGWRCALPTSQALHWVARWYRQVAAGVSARTACDEQISEYLGLIDT